VTWLTTPAQFGAALTGEQADLPALPTAFAEAVRNVGPTELKFRKTYFGMMLERK